MLIPGEYDGSFSLRASTLGIDHRSLMDEARVLIEQKQFVQAVERCLRFAELCPELAADGYHRAAVAVRRGLHEKDPHCARQLSLLPRESTVRALGLYRQALEQWPEHPQALLGLSQLTEDPQERVAALERLNRVWPRFHQPEAGLALGQALEAAQQWERACAVYEVARGHADPKRRALRRQAELFLRLGRKGEARQLLRELSQPRPDRHKRIPLAPTPDQPGRCPRCGHEVDLETGVIDPSCLSCGQALKQPGSPGGTLWTVVANIVEEHTRGPLGEVVRGAGRFRPGARVYYAGDWGGYPDRRARMIGMDRGSRRYILMVVQTCWLTNFRLAPIYKPAVLDLIRSADLFTRENAERWLEIFRRTQAGG